PPAARPPATPPPAAAGPRAAPPPPAARPPAGPAGPAGPSGTAGTGSSRSQGSRRTGTTRTTSRRTSAIGAGLVDVAPAPTIDPATVVLADPTVSEDKRFCSNCGAPVGRARPDAPEGRLKGVCSQCRHRFDFEPKLGPGTIVGGQYEVAGA